MTDLASPATQREVGPNNPQAAPDESPTAAGKANAITAAGTGPAEASLPGQHPFQFHGDGAEYFRIWIVNLLLTVATLGVYSAWAKVRRLQYFYRNTTVDGAIFDYHGDPKAILKGRIVALGLFTVCKIAFDVSPLVAVLTGVLLVAIMPWLLARSFRFRLANSSYRGVRFHFSGTISDAYRALVLLPLILVVTGLFVWSVATSFHQHQSIGLLLLEGLLPLLAIFAVIPLAHFQLKRYQHDHAYFGQSPFFFLARPKQFFVIYGKAIGLLVLGVLVAGVFTYLTTDLARIIKATTLGWLLSILYSSLTGYVMYLFVRPYIESRVQNLVWNKTELGDSRFVSNASARRLLWLHASNLLLIVLSAGLFRPFAAIRLIRYRVSCLALVAEPVLDVVEAQQGEVAVGAGAQEAGDFFDIEIAL
ncbi:MAG: YjgN family protein [Pseudomonadota bacterium]|nr:YjgN family protein [Pseudomonadota bacterium]